MGWGLKKCVPWWRGNKSKKRQRFIFGQCFWVFSCVYYSKGITFKEKFCIWWLLPFIKYWCKSELYFSRQVKTLYFSLQPLQFLSKLAFKVEFYRVGEFFPGKKRLTRIFFSLSRIFRCIFDEGRIFEEFSFFSPSISKIEKEFSVAFLEDEWINSREKKVSLKAKKIVWMFKDRWKWKSTIELFCSGRKFFFVSYARWKFLFNSSLIS